MLKNTQNNRQTLVKKEISLSAVFNNEEYINELFYAGRFDFVVYEKRGANEMPVLAIELDGPEHKDNPIIKERDRKK